MKVITEAVPRSLSVKGHYFTIALRLTKTGEPGTGLKPPVLTTTLDLPELDVWPSPIFCRISRYLPETRMYSPPSFLSATPLPS